MVLSQRSLCLCGAYLIDNLGSFVKIKKALKSNIAFKGPIQGCAYQHSHKAAFKQVSIELSSNSDFDEQPFPLKRKNLLTQYMVVVKD